jgi:hypothetical protein
MIKRNVNMLLPVHTATDYVSSDPSGRGPIPVTTIKQGSEPPTFTGWFQAWDPKMGDNVMANFT